LFLIGEIPMRQDRTAMVHGGLEMTPEVLAHAGREIAAEFGHPEKPADETVWLSHRADSLSYLHRLPPPRHWDEWLSAEPALKAVYRQGPRPLIAEPAAIVDSDHPPQLTPGMVRVELDGNG